MNIEMQTSRYDFSVLAEGYDSWYLSREGALYDRFEKTAVLKYLPSKPNNKTLLDVGCGTGHWSMFFSECGFTVTGLDVSQRMIDVARSKSNRDITYLAADAHRLPFPDGAFDVTSAITTLEFTRNPAGVIREMVRCTRKQGGTVLIGALNCCSWINRKRRNSGIPPYADAWFLSPHQLKNMLEPYGAPEITTTAFVPKFLWMYSLAPLYNSVGTFFHLPTGSFVIGKIQL